jgi:hypothetical protein
MIIQWLMQHHKREGGISGFSESGLKKTALPALDSTRFLNGSDTPPAVSQWSQMARKSACVPSCFRPDVKPGHNQAIAYGDGT